MKRMHRDYLTFCQKVWQFNAKHGLIGERQKVVVAVSGGIDSIALLDFFAWLRETKKIDVVAAHVNHKLRGKESDGDEKFVHRVCAEYAIPLFTERVLTKKIAKQTKCSVQETARDLRYSFFDTLQKSLNANAVATAHNANDNAETMLINIFRGSGVEGLGGIPLRRNEIVRPFLCVTRKEIERYVKKRKLPYREDSTNKHVDYTRNYLRHKIIPNIEQRLNPSLINTLFRMSEIFRMNAAFTTDALKAVPVFDPLKGELNIRQLEQIHPYLQQMLLHRVLTEKNIEPAYETIHSILDLKENQKGTIVDLDKSFVAERIDDAIVIRKRVSPKEFEFRLEDEGVVRTDDFIFTIKKSGVPDNKTKSDSSYEYVDASVLKFPVIVRNWRKGDSFTPLGMRGKKKLSDFFAEGRFSSEQKKKIPVVESGNKIVWIAGKRLDDRFKLTDKTTEAYQLTITFNGKKNDQS
ncbi:MAG: tRNA lysidine(34) synthetase TilS [Bacteroidota bacterium]